MRRNQKRKRKTGASRRQLLLLLSSLLAAPAAWAGKDDEEYAVVAGTVFRDPGFAVPRAEVILSLLTPPQGKKAPKPRKLLADARGEFVFRVPAGPAKYRVRAAAEGLEPQEKDVDVNGTERVDVYITLKTASK